MTIPYGVRILIKPNVTVTFSVGVSVMGNLEMKEKTTINSDYIVITGSSGTFETSGTSSARNNVNISNYGELAVGGFLNGKYTTFNFGNRSYCRISQSGRIYMDEYNHMRWTPVPGTTYSYNTYNSVFQGNGEKGSWNGFIVENMNSSNALEYLHIRDAVAGISYSNSRTSIRNNSIVNCNRAMEFYNNSVVNNVTGNIFYANGEN